MQSDVKSDREILEWMLQFAQMDLDQARPGDLLNLEDDIGSFLGWEKTSDTEGELSLSSLGDIQQDLRQLFEDVAQANMPLPNSAASAPHPTVTDTTPTWRRAAQQRKVRVGRYAPGLARQTGPESATARPTSQITSLSFAMTSVPRLYFELLGPGQGRLLVEAGLRDTFLFAVGFILSRVDFTYLRRCLTCERLFFAEHGRQIFCSSKCANRQATKRFREKRRDQAAGKEQASSQRQHRPKRSSRTPSKNKTPQRKEK